jgi:alpha-D-xyloside xylohydrolase
MTFDGLTNPYVTFPGQLPDLPIRGPDDSGGPTYITRATLVGTDANGIMLTGTTSTGTVLNVTVRIAAPGIVRVLLQDGKADPKRVQLARDLSDQPVAITLEKSAGQITLVSDSVRVRIALDPFQMSFYGPDGSPVLAEDTTNSIVTDRLNTLPLGFSAVDGQRVAFHDSFAVEPDEHFYGFGEKFTDFDKRGQVLEMWAYDAFGVHGERAYKNVPFFISSRGYGVFVDSTTAIRFDMAASNHALFSLIVPDSLLDYYVIMGPDPKTIITRYAGLVSFPTLPPKWSLGLWMSCGFVQDTADDVLQHARSLREHHVPCDVIHIDPYWMRMGCWADLIWDKQNFSDPDGLIREMKAQGFKLCLWMNPYIGIHSERHAEGIAKGYFLKTPQGDPWIGDAWSGGHPDVSIIDMTNPAAIAWFKDSLRPLLRQGIDTFKTDFGELLPYDIVAHNGMTGAELHNLYPLLYNDAVTDTIREETHRAPVVWGRSTYAGGQRHAAQWGGDPNCTYSALASTLRGGLSFAMSGHAFWGHDLGGFHTKPTPDLYARWAQMGLFSPMSRAHGMTSRLPWEYGEELLRIFTDYVRLRYRLMPYLYTYASRAAATGLPIIRPMPLEFPNDPLIHALDLEYMFGEEFLVAPIYNEAGQRPIYFPAGRWIDFWTREIIDGPQVRQVSVPLDILPLYVRANALIPTVEPAEYLTDDPFDLVTFEGYLLDQGSFALDDVDGLTQLSAALEGTQLRVEWASPKPRAVLHVIPLAGQPAIQTVQVNGQASKWSRSADGGLMVTLEK